MKTWMLCVAFSLGVVGCGAPPSTPMTVDAGFADVPVTSNDVPVVADNGQPTDNGTTPVDAGAPAVCIPTVHDDGSRELCAGAAMCQPNLVNPTCAGAMACDCGMTAADMPSAICTPETMPSCTTAVTCTVGHNHCSVHLPPAVDYAEYTMMEPTALGGHGGLRNTVRESWISEDRMTEDRFITGSIYDNRGFVQVCLQMPLDPVVTTSMGNIVACTTCTGHTCYWNRGRTSSAAPSIEIEFSDNACAFRLSIYPAGAASPSVTRNMISQSSGCSSS